MGLFKRYQFENTRAWVRLPAEWYVKYTIEGSDRPEALGTTRDVSAGGLRMVTRENVPVSSRARIKINTLILPRAIQAVGRVVRVLELGQGMYEWGVAFEEINPDDRQDLNRQIEAVSGPRGMSRHRRSWWRKVD